MLIYKITNLKNSKIYVGQTINTLQWKIGQYKKDVTKLKTGKIPARPILSALIKYGVENFQWEIIENDITDGYVLDKREIYWIKELDSANRKIGYNVALGGDCPTRGRKLEGDQLEKARASALLASQVAAEMFRGKPKTGIMLETTLENIKKAGKKSAEVRLGKALSEQHRNNISKGNTNNPKRIAASRKPKLKARVPLTNEQIDDIRNDNDIYKKIAEKYHISTTTVSRIKNNQRYFKK